MASIVTNMKVDTKIKHLTGSWKVRLSVWVFFLSFIHDSTPCASMYNWEPTLKQETERAVLKVGKWSVQHGEARHPKYLVIL